MKLQVGFTLIEILLYVSILGMIFGFTILAADQMISNYERLRYQRELMENQKFLTQKLIWLLQNNAAINSPAAGASADSLSVNKLNFSGNPLVIGLNGGRVWLTVGTSTPISLTNNYVTVSNVSFTHFNFSGHDAIRFRANLINNVASTSIDTTIRVK